MVIYKTINKLNGKIYIGQDKNNNPDYLGSGKILQQAIEKYGKENFEKEILEECNSKEYMNDAEIYWISYYNSTDKKIGYNIAVGGSGGDTISNHPDKDKISKKISISNSGKKSWNAGLSGTYKQDPSVGQKISTKLKGKRHSEETKEKQSRARKRWHENLTESQKQDISDKISASNMGKKMPPKTEEQKHRHSRWMKENNPMKGKAHTDEAKEKMRHAHLGKPKTQEHRKKLSEANKGSKPTNMVKIEIDGIVFESLADASRKTGINMSTLRNRIKSKNYEGYKKYEEKPS
jgi:group I intron endonuclease